MNIMKTDFLIQKMLLKDDTLTPLQKYYMWEYLRKLGEKRK